MNDDILQTVSHVGFGHKNCNEDASIVLNHPKIDDLKLMVVADGVGGSCHGEIAAQSFCRYMGDWFKHIDVDEANFLPHMIKVADRLIYSDNKRAGIQSSTVASVVLITPENTHIATVGDTRVYIIKDEKLKRIERPETFYEKALITGDFLGVDVERAKMMPEGYIGHGMPELCNPDDLVIDNDYDGILAITDGVYKQLSDEQLEKIILNCDLSEVVSYMVNLAAGSKLENDKYTDLNIDVSMKSNDNVTVAAFFSGKSMLKKADRAYVKKI